MGNRCIWGGIWHQIWHRNCVIEKKRAQAAHFHACWLFWPPRSLSIAASFLCSMPFASWLWTEMGLSTRLSFEVLWLSAKRSAVPAAICEGAANSRPSLHFPSMTERGWSQEWRWVWQRHPVRVGWPHVVEPVALSVIREHICSIP